MSPPPPETTANGTPLDRTSGLAGQSLLLVDDETDILRSLQSLFEKELPGIVVRTATSGAAGLDSLRRNAVDLIVCDYKMPGMNGLDFLGQAQRIVPGVPRILVTAYPDLEVAVRAIRETGIEGFFIKPFDPDQVLDTVSAALYERLAQRLRRRSIARSVETLGSAKSNP
jgi:DNA-binding NtrC family response regulator